MVGISLVERLHMSTSLAEKLDETTFEDHRIRVSASRTDEASRGESAPAVATEEWSNVAVIDDFIAAAGVSRETFCNHLKTTHEMLLALATAVSAEVLQIMDSPGRSRLS